MIKKCKHCNQLHRSDDEIYCSEICRQKDKYPAMERYKDTKGKISSEGKKFLKNGLLKQSGWC